MKTNESYDFNLFKPRNLHGRKNRNVILTMLLVWVVAVFGFQFLLRGIQKPVPEKTLRQFESTWPAVLEGKLSVDEYKTFLNTLVLVRGKTTVRPEDKVVISSAISCAVFKAAPDSIKALVADHISGIESLNAELTKAKDQEYLNIKTSIGAMKKSLTELCEPISGFGYGSLEAAILTGSLNINAPDSFTNESFARLPEIMSLYLTHNQSVLTDTIFLGFPFHYFYTAVLLLILFVGLCIIYNVLIEWRLNKQGVVES